MNWGEICLSLANSCNLLKVKWDFNGMHVLLLMTNFQLPNKKIGMVFTTF